MAIELGLRGIAFERQKMIEICYKGHRVARGRIDLLIEDKLIVEVKSVDALGPIHRMQVLSYMPVMKHTLALLINFNVPVLKDGIRRIILS